MPYARVKNELPLIPGYASGDIISISDAFPGAPVNKLTADVSGSGCIIKRTGENLFDINSLTSANITIADGVASGTAGAFNVAFGQGVPGYKFKPDTVYTFSLDAYTDGNASTASNGLVIGFIYKDGTNSVRALPNDTASFTRFSITSNGKSISKVVFSYATSGLNIWHIKNGNIEEGTGTEYEQYTGSTYPITFPSSVSDGSITINSDGSVDLTSEGTTTRLTDTAQVTTTSGLNNIWVDTGDIENLVYIRR